MLRAAVLFFILAIFSFIFGAYGVAGLSMDIGRLLLTVFLIISIVSFVVSIFNQKNRKNI